MEVENTNINNSSGGSEYTVPYEWTNTPQWYWTVPVTPVLRCTCGQNLENWWKYCPTCGRRGN
jgi:hypothetical protein